MTKTTEPTCPKCGAICFDGPRHFNCKREAELVASLDPDLALTYLETRAKDSVELAVANACEGKRNDELTPAQLKARVAVASKRLQAHFNKPEVREALADALGVGDGDKTDPLAQAIAALGAVEVAPNKYARLCDHENCKAMGIGPQAHTGPRWFIMVPGALELLAEDLRTGTTSEGWCTLKGDPVMMPAWWTPERRTITQCESCRIPWAQDEFCVDHHLPRNYTADLTTGQEIPA